MPGPGKAPNRELEYQEHNIPPKTKRILPIEHSFDSGKVSYELDSDGSIFLDWLRNLEPGDLVACDLETTSLNPYAGEITLIGVSSEGKRVILLPRNLLADENLKLAFNNLMADESINKTFHNAKFDMKWLRAHYGTEFKNCDCSYVMRRMLIMGLDRAASLDACSFDYLGYEMDKAVREQFIGNLVVSDEMAQYCAIDVAATWHIHPILLKYLEIEQTIECYQLIEKPLVFVVAKMELQGINIDVDYLKNTLQPKFEETIADRQNKLDSWLKTLKVMPKKERKVRPDETEYRAKGWTHINDYEPSLNVFSSKKVTEVLNSIGFEVKSSAKEVLEQPTYTEESIERAKEKMKRPELSKSAILKIGHEICETILELRKCRKGISSFIVPLQSEFTDAKTGRIHASFNQMGTVTGRFSHSEPNLAQMPKPNEKGVYGKTPLRRAFLPPPGYKFIVFDYAACELRILAEVTQDPTLLVSVVQDDPHAINAAKMYESRGVTVEDCSKGGEFEELRDRAKNGIYLKTYGGGKKRLAAVLKCPVDEAAGVLDAFDAAMPGVPEWGEGVKACALQRGFTRSLSGRKRYYELPDMNEVGWRGYKAAEAAIERQAGNMPIQATNADITKLGMVWTDERITPLGGMIVIQVHDEIVAVAPEATVAECAELMKQAMLDAEMEFLQTVESKVDGGYGDYWDH